MALLFMASCGQAQEKYERLEIYTLELGNQQTEQYFPLLKDKRVALVANHSSILSGVHLVDSLLNAGIQIQRVFSPEHGFRGDADAGEKVSDAIDQKTGLPLVSLYGKNKKPKASQLNDVDVIVFDIQDVGARFYTYISTLHYVMEAAAEQGIPLIVLDRPNPNAHYVDGPVLEMEHQSFVGMHPVPVVHGMTIGEYAQMINGEGWLPGAVKCNLKVIPCKNYSHQDPFEIQTPPSPNLPSANAVKWYPSLCFFEGTPVSVGRGTKLPFEQIGHPQLIGFDYSFVPRSMPGAKNPKLKGKTCYGLVMDSKQSLNELDLSYLIKFHAQLSNQDQFFSSFFTLLAGTENLQNQIESGMQEEEIRASWKPELEQFKSKRKKYLLYPDFE